jgi:O-antigen/teichoic acid export membrane protein
LKNRSSIHNLTILLSSQVVVMILGLLAQVIVARFLLPDGRGIYAICIMFASMMSVITYMGNEYGIRYLLLKNNINIQQAFRYLLLTVSIALSFSIVIFYLVKNLNIEFLQRGTEQQFILALLLGFTQVICVQTNVFLTIAGKFRDASKISVGLEFLKLLFVIIALLLISSVEAALIAAILSNILIIFVYIYKYELLIRAQPSMNIADMLFIYRYGFKSWFLTLSNFSNIHIGTLVLSFYVSTEKLGIYSIAFALVSRVQVIPDAINRVMVPRLASEGDAVRERYFVLSTFMILFFLCLGILCFLILFSDDLVYVLFGSNYLEAVPLIKFLFVGFAFKILSKPFEAYFNEILGEPSVIAKIHLLTLVLLIFLMNLLIPEYELMGATFTNIIVFFTGFMLILISFIMCSSKGELTWRTFPRLVFTIGELMKKVIKK